MSGETRGEAPDLFMIVLDVLNFVGDFNLSIITAQFTHASSGTDVAY